MCHFAFSGASDTDDDDESSDNGDDDSADNRLEEDETDTASPDDSGNSAEDDDSGDDDDLRSHKTITFSHTKYQDEVGKGNSVCSGQTGMSMIVTPRWKTAYTFYCTKWNKISNQHTT